MKHFSREFKKKTANKEIDNCIASALDEIKNINCWKDMILQEIESCHTRHLFNYIGQYRKYEIVISETLTGILEIFKSDNSEYLTIYTSPLNGFNEIVNLKMRAIS
jgi:hypothetical protein